MTVRDRLVGRDADRQRLLDALADDVPVAVRGEAGVGKTTLVRSAVAASGRRLHEGGALALLSWSPFLALERALGRPVPGGDPALVGREVARRVGAGVLFLDDLQWAHPATLEVLARLAGRVALVAAIRTGDRGTAPAEAAARDAGLLIHDLEPLDVDAVVDLVRLLRPDLPPAEAQRIARTSGGNPLFVEELCRPGGSDDRAGRTVRIQLAELQPDELETLALIARAERPVPAAVAGPAARVLLARGLAVEGADGHVAVRHDLIGAAAVERTEPDVLRDIDARLARVVDDPAEAARHHLRAGERADAHRRAQEAVAAARTADERAAHLALVARTADGPEATDLHLDAVAALLEVGRADEALELLGPDEALPTRVRPRRALLAARALRYQGLVDDAALVARQGLALPGLDPASEVGLTVEVARTATEDAGRRTDAVELAAAALRRARAVGAHVAAARTAYGLALHRLDRDGWEAELRAAIETARATGDVASEDQATHTLIFSTLRDGRPAAALAVAGELAERGRALGRPAWELDARFWEIGLSWHLGRFREALDAAERLEREAEEDSDFYRIQVLVDLGRLDEARVRAERFAATEPPGEYREGEALWALADLQLAAGRPAEAHAAAERHRSRYPTAGHRPFVAVTQAWAALSLGLPIQPLPPDDSLALLDGAPLEVAGIAALAAGRHDDAVDRFDAAAAAWAGRHARGWLRARWGATEALRAAGSVDEARERLLGLEADVEAHGAAGHLPRIHRSLRSVGVRRSAARRRVDGSPLTERELEILHLVGAGLRDREIAERLGISRWAVLRAVDSGSAKLGATSRAQAVARLPA